MEYEEYRKKSETGIRQTEPVKEGQTGYKPAEKEKQENLTPKEVSAIKTGDGMISLGVNRKKEVTMTLMVDNEKSLREDRNAVDMDKAKVLPNTRGKMFVNSHDRNQSAVAVKVALEKQCYGLETKLWSTAKHLAENSVVEETLPFITHQKEGIKGAPAYLHQQQEEKSVEQKMMAGIEKLKQEAEAMESHSRNNYRSSIVSEQTAEDGPLEDEEDEFPENEEDGILKKKEDREANKNKKKVEN